MQPIGVRVDVNVGFEMFVDVVIGVGGRVNAPVDGTLGVLMPVDVGLVATATCEESEGVETGDGIRGKPCEMFNSMMATIHRIPSPPAIATIAEIGKGVGGVVGEGCLGGSCGGTGGIRKSKLCCEYAAPIRSPIARRISRARRRKRTAWLVSPMPAACVPS